jgi:hypothetical protein
MAEYNERWRAGRIDHVDAHPGKLGDFRLVGRDGGLELVQRPAAHVEAER